MTASSSEPAYEPNWHSLSQHATPPWLRGAKFGVYSHWGLASVRQFPGNVVKWKNHVGTAEAELVSARRRPSLAGTQPSSV